ncbi:MAG: family 1 glycosylhydrolase [Actinomycetota bacterium]|nr:family 1 glycosylhydrolase [Actinomycetota bacterium]
MSSLSFPENFIFGTATSSFQIEGAGYTEWKNFTGADGTKLGTAIDHYRKYKEDLDYILYLGNAYRFSMDWSKLQRSCYSPLDNKTASHYMEIFKTLKKNSKKTMLVLNHFSNPLWFFNKGGWTSGESVKIYFDYVKKVLDIFSGYIDYINTFNEPGAYAIMTYIMKEFPPKKFSPIQRNKVLRHMSRAHREVYDYIKDNFPNIKVGISHACMFTRITSRYSIWQNFLRWFLEHYMFESVHELFTAGKKVDYIGFSYYGRILISKYLTVAYEQRGREALDRLGLEYDDMWEIYPAGIYHLIKKFYKKYSIPIIITENGTSTYNDEFRAKNLYNHLRYIKKAIDEGIEVRGYFHWSTFDNFELAHGPSRRFGLVSIDYNSPDLKREIKKSGEYYHRISSTNKLIEYRRGQHAGERK